MGSAAPGAGLVSVIIPTRNRPTLLRAAIDSVLSQTRPADQIVVVDDASDGATWLPAIEALSPTIEVVRRAQRGGAAATRNEGLDWARGDYLLFLDDDDLIAPELIEKGLAVLAANADADGVFFRYRTIVSSDASNDRTPFVAERPSLRRAIFDGEDPLARATLEHRRATAFLRHLVPVHSGFLRRSAVDEVRFLDSLRQGEDTHFWISLVAAGRRFVLDDHPYAIIRRHAGNTTRSRARHIAEIQICYERLLADGLLVDADDAYLAHFKLLLFKSLSGGKGAGRHLKHVMASPRLLAAELRLWTTNLVTRLVGSARARSDGARPKPGV